VSRIWYTFIGVGLGLVLAVLAACGSAPVSADETTNSSDVHAEVVTLPSGGTVTCVVYEGYKAGGLDCDWGNE
jgi:hypothetical protein